MPGFLSPEIQLLRWEGSCLVVAVQGVMAQVHTPPPQACVPRRCGAGRGGLTGRGGGGAAAAGASSRTAGATGAASNLDNYS